MTNDEAREKHIFEVCVFIIATGVHLPKRGKVPAGFDQFLKEVKQFCQDGKSVGETAKDWLAFRLEHVRNMYKAK